MQALKNLISGPSDETQSGQEPASGQTGAGTTNEPYDAGNTTGNSTLGGSAPSESTYGSSNTNVESTFGGSTSGSSNSNVESTFSGSTLGGSGSTTGGAENTFARDRGGPSPGNKGPHTISIANKLDPNVDSDGDGKPRSGPADIEHATVGSVSTGSGQTASSAGNSSSITGSTSNDSSTPNYDSRSYGNITGNTPGEIAGETPSTDYSSSAQGRNTYSHANTTSSTTPGSGPYSSTTSGSSTSNPSRQEDPSRYTGVNITGGIHPEHQTDKTGVTSMHSTDPHFSDQRLTSSNQSSVPDRGQARAPIGGFGAVEPSVGADFSSERSQSQKEQGADRPLEEPSGRQVDAVRGEKESIERQQAGGQAGQGTGELWVKSTGMAADGGDFDAAKPGAGREADRLMEQKGVHHDH